MLIKRLEEAPKGLGAKAERLRELTQLGFPVPLTYVFMDILNLDNLENYREELNHLLKETMGGCPVAVRSSVSDEDLPFALAPGVYDSFLNLSTVDEVIHAIQVCRDNLYHADAIAYRTVTGIEDNMPSMNVMVQKMIPTEIAGVLYTQSPLSVSPVMLVEWAEGLGTDVVAGRDLPYATIPRQKIVNRCEWIVPSEGLRDVLHDLGMMLENYYGCPQDIEWGIFEGRLYLFQTRPASLNRTEDLVALNDQPTFEGKTVNPVASGYALGRIVTVAEKPYNPLMNPQLLILNNLSNAMGLVDSLPSQGLLVRAGNALSHAAAMCREFGIATAFTNNPEPSDKLYALDAVRGVIAPFESLSPAERKKFVFGAMRTLAKRHPPTARSSVDDKYEAVIIDPISCTSIIKYLTEIGIQPVTFIENIFPYDQNERCYTGISARVKQEGDNIVVQFKRAHNLPDRPMRFDQEVHIEVDTLEEADKLLSIYGYQSFDPQQRQVQKWVLEQGTVFIFRWPGTSSIYAGIESVNPEWIINLLQGAGVKISAARPFDGSHIFKIIGIPLVDLRYTF